MSQFDKTITLLDSSFAVVGDPIRAFESLSYSDAWEDHGALSLVVEKAEYPNIKLAAWLMVDGRVYENESVFGDAKNENVKVEGASLSVLFDRIVITADERLQGRAEERVRYLVNKYAITGSQAVTGLALGTDNDFKRAMDITVKRGQTLSEVLFTALPQRGLSFEIVCLCDGSGLQFNVLQGLDRTSTQSVNAPVTMSTRAEIEKAEYKRTIMDYRNYAIVCDEQDTPQTVEVDMTNGEPVRAMYVSGKSAGVDDSAAANQFVFVGQYTSGVGFIGTSIDGATVTNRVTAGYGSLWAVDFEAGEFIACGNSGTVLTAIDPATWTSQTLGTSYALESTFYNDGMYIAAGNGAEIWASYDKATWTRRWGGGSVIIKSTTYINDIAIACANRSSGNVNIYYSSDLWLWNYYTFPTNAMATLSVPITIINVNGSPIIVGYVVVGGTEIPFSAIGARSAIAFDWTYNEATALSGKRFLDAAYGNGVIVAVGQPNIIVWSDDLGATWHDVTPSGGTPDYIAVCFDGTNFHAYSATTKHHAYSATGKSFTLGALTTSAGLIDAVVYGISSHSGDLYQIGVDALTEAAIVETLDGDVNADLAPVYKVDYNIGDVIDAVDPDHDLVAAKRVLSVEYLVDKTTDLSITPKLGKDALTLRKLIAKEIKNNGI